MADLRVEFCDEWYDIDDARPFVVGRGGDLQVDDNPYLHRRFLEIVRQGDLWWLANVGTQLAATVADPEGRFQAWLAPGARLPVVFDRLRVRFTAGPTSYGFDLHAAVSVFDVTPTAATEHGSTTLGRVVLTPEQHQLIVALAAPALQSERTGRIQLPTSADAARRLGWSITKFNRKLDNVCQKLERAGVHGVHGEEGNLASNRRARLVEYALAVRLVTLTDLASLPTDEGAVGPMA